MSTHTDFSRFWGTERPRLGAHGHAPEKAFFQASGRDRSLEPVKRAPVPRTGPHLQGLVTAPRPHRHHFRTSGFNARTGVGTNTQTTTGQTLKEEISARVGRKAFENPERELRRVKAISSPSPARPPAGRGPACSGLQVLG